MVADDRAIQEGPIPPDVGHVARQLLGAMIATEGLPDAMGSATVSTEDDTPIYLMLIVIGPINVPYAMKHIRPLAEHLSREDADAVFWEES